MSPLTNYYKEQKIEIQILFVMFFEIRTLECK